MALFYLNDSGDLLPISIQLYQQTEDSDGKRTPVRRTLKKNVTNYNVKINLKGTSLRYLAKVSVVNVFIKHVFRVERVLNSKSFIQLKSFI